MESNRVCILHHSSHIFSQTFIFCFQLTECTADKCGDEGEEGAGVCHEVNGECEIRCGEQHYREGDYCYFCSDIGTDTYCQQCNKSGSCAACRSDIDLEHGECVNRQQEAIEALAAEVRKVAGYEGCQAPNVYECDTGTACSGEGCGSLAMTVDANKRVITLVEYPFIIALFIVI